MGLRITDGMAVKIAYRMSDSDGRVLEERTPENPYEYIQGNGQIVGPLERAVAGKTAGFATEVSITPRDGYGDYDSSLVTTVSRKHLPAELEVQVGMKFNTISPLGTPMIVRVIEVNGDKVTLDGNHPLAGLELNFDLRVLDVRDPQAKVEFDPSQVNVSVRAKKH